MDLSPLGILGGTFDPIHFGHLRLAEEMRDQAGLGEIRFVPTGAPPHRGSPQVSAQHRSAMVRLAVAGQPAFVPDDRELARSGPCYTVDTLRELRAELGDARPLCLLMGGDAFLQLHTWHEWKDLFTLAHIVVGSRPGFALDEHISGADAALQRQYDDRRSGIETLSQWPRGGIVELTIPRLEISATDIRRRVAEGRSIRYLLPDAVADYINQHKLYTPC